MARVQVFQGGNVAREGTTPARLQTQDYRHSPLTPLLEGEEQSGRD